MKITGRCSAPLILEKESESTGFYVGKDLRADAILGNGWLKAYVGIGSGHRIYLGQTPPPPPSAEQPGIAAQLMEKVQRGFLSDYLPGFGQLRETYASVILGEGHSNKRNISSTK